MATLPLFGQQPVAKILASSVLAPVRHQLALATLCRWTSSGPSAKRKQRAHMKKCAIGVSVETPIPPWICMQRSMTSCAICGATTLIIAMWLRACFDVAVDLLGGVQRQQPRLLDLDPRARNLLLDDALLRERLAERRAPTRARTRARAALGVMRRMR